jgi:hypothetical protein
MILNFDRLEGEGRTEEGGSRVEELGMGHKENVVSV